MSHCNEHLQVKVYGQGVHHGTYSFHDEMFSVCSVLVDFHSNYLEFVPCAGQFHVYLTQARISLKEGTPVKKMPSPDWPVSKPVVHFLD